MEAFTILLKLLCAHFCADFIFQTDSINDGKHKSGNKGIVYQFIHSLIHAGTAYLFIAEWSCWLVPLIIFISHFLIDMVKCWYHKGHKDSLSVFLADQIAHIVVIVLLWLFYYSKGVELSCVENIFTTKTWLIVMAYIVMLKPSSIFLSLFLKKWIPTSTNMQSLPNAGQWIGYIERILTLTFILVGSIEGVGFLLAAKSVFRLGELNSAKEIRTTEYVLIGTLASFTIAILIGIALTHLL